MIRNFFIELFYHFYSFRMIDIHVIFFIMICIYPLISLLMSLIRFFTGIIFYINLNNLRFNRCLLCPNFILRLQLKLNFLQSLFRLFDFEWIFTLLILVAFYLVRSFSQIRNFLFIDLLLFINNLDSFLVKLLKLLDLGLHW